MKDAWKAPGNASDPIDPSNDVRLRSPFRVPLETKTEVEKSDGSGIQFMYNAQAACTAAATSSVEESSGKPIPDVVLIEEGAAQGEREYRTDPCKLQLYFTHATDAEVDGFRGMPPFFVSHASNADGIDISTLHQGFFDAVGGFSGAVNPGNRGGYVGGLTANLAIAEAMHAPIAGERDAHPVGRDRSELLSSLIGAMAVHKKFKDQPQDRLHEQAVSYVEASNLSFRDFIDMRTGEPKPAKIKDSVPLFGPSAWERLHMGLRKLAFLVKPKSVPYELPDGRAFSCSTDEWIAAFLDGKDVVSEGATIACHRDDKGRYHFQPEVPDAPPELVKQIEGSMAALQISYSNAVFDGITELEDSGFAFLHVYEVEMAQQKYRHDRNKGLVYTVGPCGNKSRYPDDVRVQLTLEQWMKRVQLTGRNVVRAAKIYNEFAASTGKPLMTVLRTPLVAGGAFMLKDEQEKPLINLHEHAKHYIRGMLEELAEQPGAAAYSGIKRLEFMTPDPNNPHAFKDGARLLLE